MITPADDYMNLVYYPVQALYPDGGPTRARHATDMLGVLAGENRDTIVNTVH